MDNIDIKIERHQVTEGVRKLEDDWTHEISEDILAIDMTNEIAREFRRMRIRKNIFIALPFLLAIGAVLAMILS
jgi:hypothetical protein